MKPVCSLIAVVILGSSASIQATEPTTHPFHTSMAEVEYNPQSKALEVALKLYAVDAEQALHRIRKKGTKFDFDNEKQRDALFAKYLPSRFVASALTPAPDKPSEQKKPAKPQAKGSSKAKRPALRYVGSEVEGAYVWAYFELPVDVSKGQFELVNKVLTGVQLEQLNVVTFKSSRGRSQTLYFDRKTPKRSISIAPRVR